MNDINYYGNRLFVLVKKPNSWFDSLCICPQCVKHTYDKIKIHKWEVIRKGTGKKMYDQKIMLNKLYGKS